MTAQPQSSQPDAVQFLNLRRVGILTAAVYLLACLFYIEGPLVYTRAARELFNWFCVLSLLFLFWKGYQIVKQSPSPPPVRTLVIFAGVFCLLAFFTFPFHSTDVFGYINRGWQQVHYHQNPYVYRVGDIPAWQQDPMLWDHWIYNPNPYGFLFSLLARFVCYVAYGNWWASLLLFKAVNVAAFALATWLTWSGARASGHARPHLALYLMLWNPLLLMHHIANGHNDILTGCLIVVSMYLLITGRGLLWVVPALVAATLLKYAPALLLPFALVHVYRQRGWKTVALGCLIGALIFALVSAPYIQDWRAFRVEDIGTNATLIDNSLHSLLIHIYENIARLIPPLARFHDTADALIKNTIRLGFVLFLVFQGLKTLLKKTTPEELVERSLLVMFVLICVVSSKFNAWYMAILLPHALLLRERHWLRRLVVLISCTELLSLTFFKQAYMLNYFAMILAPMWIVFRRERRERASAETSAVAGSEELQL